nr:YusW family protein [Sporosarcina limicola]
MTNKRQLLMITALSFLLIIGACSDKNKVTTMPSETTTSKKSLGSTYGFTSLNLTIDTKEMTEALIANYDEKRAKTEAMYQNKIEDLYLHGNKAMEKLDSIFNDFPLEPDMDEEDLIKKASESFDIVDYKKLKLEIKFKGHEKKKMLLTK